MHRQFQSLADLPGNPPANDAGDGIYANRRNSGRVVIGSDVRCNLGEVIDLSGTGMRLLAKKAMCGAVGVTLLSPGFGVRLQAEIVWSKRHGFRRHLLGVRFLEVDPHAFAILTRIASEYRTRRAA